MKNFSSALLTDLGTVLPGSPHTPTNSENHLAGEEDSALKFFSFLVILHFSLAQLFLFLFLFCIFEVSIVTISADIKLVLVNTEGNPDHGTIIPPEISPLGNR